MYTYGWGMNSANCMLTTYLSIYIRYADNLLYRLGGWL
jgi:hypothetical protein